MNIEKLKEMSHSEINHLCATKIMGFNWHNNFEMWIGNGKAYDHWNPTEDINDAMELVNTLNDRLFSIYANPEWSSSKRFTIHVSKNSMAMNSVEIDLNELPLAISYAALLSKV